MDQTQSTENIPTRTNNPGDLRFVGQTGATPDPSGFASFQSPKEGFGALLNDVQSKINKSPTSTIADFANVYAPSSDGNNSAQYAANLANKLGVPPNATLSSLQPKIGQFAEAIGSNEGYKDINSNPNPSSQEVQDSTPSNPDSMPTWEKILFGVGALGVGGAALAFGQPELLPEAGTLGAEAAGTSAAGAVTDSGIFSKIGGAIKNAVTSKVGQVAEAAGIGSVPGIVSDVLGNKKNTANSTDQANATAGAGATEAEATKNAQEINSLNQESLQDEQETQSALQNTKVASQAYIEQLENTAGGTKVLQSPQGQMGINSLATNGIVPSQNSQGRFQTQENQQEVKTALQELDDKEQEIHTASGDKGNLDEVAREAKLALRKDNRIPSTDWESGDELIDKRIESYKKNMGENPTLGRGGIGQIRADGYKDFDRNASSVQNAVGKSLGRGANTHMLNRTSSKELISGLHKEKEKLINAKAVLKHLDGKKAFQKHGFFHKALRGTGEYIGITLGDKLGGPVGAIIGDMVGKNIINMADKRYGKNVFEKPAVRKALEMLHSENPKIHAKIEKELKKYGVKMETLKKDLEHAKVLEQKRGEYKAKKTRIEKGAKSEYSPYKNPGIIKAGETPKKNVPNDAVSHESSPNVFGPDKKPEILKKKRPELYEKYSEPGIINFGSSKRNPDKSLPIIR